MPDPKALSALFDQIGDSELHLIDFFFDRGVVLVAVSFEPHRRTKADLEPDREWNRKDPRREGHVRRTKQPSNAARVHDRGDGLATADETEGHDGRFRLQREPHEARSELHER